MASIRIAKSLIRNTDEFNSLFKSKFQEASSEKLKLFAKVWAGSNDLAHRG